MTLYTQLIQNKLLTTLKHISFGILLLFSVGVMTGCASVPGNIHLPEVSPQSASPASLEEAIVAKNASVLREYIVVWEEEQRATRKDPFTAALAAYRIGFASNDHSWSALSINLFDNILDENPEFILARAWRGSAYAIYAGDHPVKGFWLIIPGPGFARLEYVRRAFRDLNDAVEAAPNDPAIRLIRASTFIGMPKIFGGYDTGIEDFAILDKWTNTPASNQGNVDLLASQEWRSEYYLNRARSMVELEDLAGAREAWQNLLQTSDDPADKELAQWHLR